MLMGTMLKAIFYILLLGFGLRVHAQTTPLRPGGVPLAVRTPYVNFWLLGGRQGPNLGHDWPRFANNANTGWSGYVRVDGTNYRVLSSSGDGNATEATQLGLTITATQSNFELKAGPVNVWLNFLSPIESTDYVKMSLPFSYLAVEIESNDGKAHDVKVYFDLTGETISGDVGTDFMTWGTSIENGVVYHDFALQTPQRYIQKNDRILYGRAYHATTADQGVSYATCSHYDCRNSFGNNGQLDGTKNTRFREVAKEWPVMALSYSFGTITKTQQPIVFAVGHARDPVVEYRGPNNVIEERSLYFRTAFERTEDALAFFIKDYPNALKTAKAFDSKLISDASMYSGDYYPALAFAARQVMAQVEITVGKNADGTLNRDDVLIFMHGSRTSAIEELYASAPFWLYVNPELLRLLLQPIINEHIRKGISSASQGAVVHLGRSYPRITGNDTPDSMPIEATGDLLIMTVAYVRASGNASIILDNYQLFDTFARFLNANTLSPVKQFSADSNPTPLDLETNLAIKGIIALKAYGDLITGLGKSEGEGYTAAGISFAQTWEQQASSMSGGDHYRLTLAPGDNMWSTEYNVFADKWLNSNVLSSSVFTRLSETYQRQLALFGVPIDGRNGYTKPEWTMFAAGIVPDETTRNKLINSVYRFLRDGPCTLPWCDRYQVTNGEVDNALVNRPVVGGVYSLLARDLPVKPLGATSKPNNSEMVFSVPMTIFLTFTSLAVILLV